MSIDMHFHSDLSDGDSTIKDILIYGKNKGLKYMFLTDHDRVSDEFIGECNNYSIQSCLSCELTVINKEYDKSLHITHYANNFSDRLRKKIEYTRNTKSEIIYKQIEKINSVGYKIDTSLFMSFIKNNGRKKSGINKFDIVKYIYHTNQNPNGVDIEDFYNDKLKKGGKLFNKYGVQIYDYEVDLSECNNEIREINSIFSIAHPNFTFKNSIDTFIKTLPSYINNGGINAIEINSKASKEWVDIIIKIAHEYGLFITFGSDCHKLGKSDNRHEDIGVKNPYITKEFMENEFNKYKNILGLT